MKTLTCILLSIGLIAGPVAAQDTDASAEPEETGRAPDPDGAKTLSGMSILGNEETPKSLVIVPWKSSELGDELSLSNSLDDQAKPVDKAVFLRELRFYEIRAGH